MLAVIVVPNVLFQMRDEKKFFQEEPVLFLTINLLASFLCAFAVHKMFLSQNN